MFQQLFKLTHTAKSLQRPFSRFNLSRYNYHRLPRPRQFRLRPSFRPIRQNIRRFCEMPEEGSAFSQGKFDKYIILTIATLGSSALFYSIFFSDFEGDIMPELSSRGSLVSKFLTEDIYAKYRHHVTKTANFTIDKCIACAVNLPKQEVGCYAGDFDCYLDFHELFDPIIEDYHSFDGVHRTDMDPAHIAKQINHGAAVKSTRIRVGRNIEGFGLSPGILFNDRLTVEELAIGAFDTFEDDLKGMYYSLADLPDTEKQALIDDHFLFVSGDHNLITGGMERDWPSGRGIFVSEDKKFLVWVNEEDQFRIISMQQGGDVEQVFTRLARGINQIESYLESQGRKFMYTDRLGYIHSCPSNLGTGMRASVHVDLGSLKAKLGGSAKLKKHCKDLRLQARGTRGESGGDTGTVYDISNRQRLGFTEVELLRVMIDGVNKLHEQNQEAKNAGY